MFKKLIKSFNVKYCVLIEYLLFLCFEYLVDVSEFVLAMFKPQSEELQTVLEEHLIVGPLEDGVLHITYQILEEGSQYDIDDLCYLGIKSICQECVPMKVLKLLTASHVLLSC